MQGTFKLQMEKVGVIRTYPWPSTKKQLNEFLRLVRFYQRFMPNFSSLAYPFSDLTRKEKPEKIWLTPDAKWAIQDLMAVLNWLAVLKKLWPQPPLPGTHRDLGLDAMLWQINFISRAWLVYRQSELKVLNKQINVFVHMSFVIYKNRYCHASTTL